MTPDELAANLATITDIAVRVGAPEGAAEQWAGLSGFPRPLIPAAAGTRVWWWPAVREYILAHGAELAGYVPPPPVAPAMRPRPAGKRGPEPGPRLLTAFDIRQIGGMHAQVDDYGRPRFTLRQIAAALSVKTDAQTVVNYSPARRRGTRGGDSRALLPEQIAQLRALRAERTPEGKRVYSQRTLAEMFGISDISVSRYCRDMRNPVPRRRRLQAVDAEGLPIADETVQRVQAMRAERDASGQHVHTHQQVADACGVTVATVKRLERGLTGP